MTQDEQIVLEWMIKMAVKEKNYPDIAQFWVDAINEKLWEILKRGPESEKASPVHS